MSRRVQATQILFPRIASRDGPAKTLFKADYVDESFQPNNPFFDTLRYGYSEETTEKVATKRTLITLHAPIAGAAEFRNAQRFQSNFKKPDSATTKLIRSRRGM